MPRWRTRFARFFNVNIGRRSIRNGRLLMRWVIPLRIRAKLRRLAAKLYRHSVVAWLPISWVNWLPLVRATREESWSIGIYEGGSPLALQQCAAANNPVLTRRHVSDVKVKFLADPFIVQDATQWHMFFEVFNLRTKKGEIAWATSQDARHWRYAARGAQRAVSLILSVCVPVAGLPLYGAGKSRRRRGAALSGDDISHGVAVSRDATDRSASGRRHLILLPTKVVDVPGIESQYPLRHAPLVPGR